MEKSGKDALLLWCQQHTRDYSPTVSISNFTTSWQDGYAFCSLTHLLNPSAFDFKIIDGFEPKKRLEFAFENAEKFGIPNVLSHAHVLENPDEASIITYITQFYFVSKKSSSSPTTTIHAVPNLKRTDRVHFTNDRLEKLQTLILETVEDFQLHLFDIELILEFIQTIDKVSEYKPLIKQVINMGNKLNEYEIPQTEQKTLFTPKVQNPNLHPKLLKFQKEMEHLFWEIRSKLFEITSQILRSKSVSLLAYYGKLVKEIKGIIRETELQQKQLVLEKRQQESMSPPSHRNEEAIRNRNKLAPSASTDEMFTMIESTVTQPTASNPSSSSTPKKNLRSTLQHLDLLLESQGTEGVNSSIENSPEFQSFLSVLTTNEEEKKNKFSNTSSPLKSPGQPRRNTVNKMEENTVFSDLLDLPCVLDEDVPTLIAVTARAEGHDLNRDSMMSFVQEKNTFQLPTTLSASPNSNETTTNQGSSEEEQVECGFCGSYNNKSWKFCGICGTLIEDSFTVEKIKSIKYAQPLSLMDSSDDEPEKLNLSSSPPHISQSPSSPRNIPSMKVVPLLKEDIPFEKSSPSSPSSPDKKYKFPQERVLQTQIKLQKTLSVVQLIIKEGYLFKLSEKRKIWKRKFFSLSPEMLTIYQNEKKEKKCGCVLLETISDIKTASNSAKKIFGFQILSEGKILYLYSRAERETQYWIESITPLHKAAKERLAKIVQKTEADGQIVLNVIMSSLQESKRMKFPGTMTISEAKKAIARKFQSSFITPSSPNDMDTFELWITKTGRWADEQNKPISFYFNTQDVVELKIKTKKEEKLKLEGYLMKRDPSGLIKGWKKRYFVLSEMKLYYAISDYNLKEIHKPIGYIDLSESHTVQMLPQISDFTFSISVPSRTYLLKAETAHEATTWVNGLNNFKDRDVDNFWIRKQTGTREGFLYKRGGRVKSWKRRWCVMKEG